MNFKEILITNREDLKKCKHSHGDYEYEMQVAVKKHIENKSCVAFYEIPSGKSNYPFHYHAATEEIFYIISGEGILCTPEGNKTIKTGDLIVCPPADKAAHKITNNTDQPLVYLDIDVMQFPDVVLYPDSNKIGIYSDSINSIHKTADKVDYYDGEDSCDKNGGKF